MFAILAVVCFLMAAFGGHIGDINLVDIGLAFLAFAILVGSWPIGTFFPSRRP